jgi:hypothetical protein
MFQARSCARCIRGVPDRPEAAVEFQAEDYVNPAPCGGIEEPPPACWQQHCEQQFIPGLGSRILDSVILFAVRCYAPPQRALDAPESTWICRQIPGVRSSTRSDLARDLTEQ